MGTFLRNVAKITLPVLLLAGGLFFVDTNFALAKTEPIGASDLTKENGWTCDRIKSSCTNDKKGSPWYKGTAKCTITTIPSPRPDIPDGQDFSCTATAADGTSITTSDSTDPGGTNGTDTVVGKDAQQNVTDIEVTPKGSTGIATCGDWNASGVAICIINTATFAVLGIANFLLGIAGTLLNWVVVKTVFEFGSLIGNSPGLLIAWGIFRDLGNMLLLFGFIFMGLATILDMGTFSAKKALPPLILFAILMNFSLFAAEAIIDTSNALTSALYAQANTDPCFNGKTEDASTGGDTIQHCGLTYGIAGSIMKSTGLATMFDRPPTSVGNEAVISIGLTLFSTIGAVVLFAASIMLVIRVVTLSFVMVTAPIGFAGMAIPPLRSLADKWWKTLISQSFFAPVLFLLIFVSLKITDSFSGSTADRGLAAALSNPSSSVLGIIMIFVIVIGFLIASLVAAKSMGSTGATFAISTAKKAATGTFGTVGGFAGRNTIGKGGQYAQKRYEAWMGKDKDSQSRKGKFARSILTNTKLDDALAGTFSAAQNAKFGSGKSLKEDQDHHKARKEVFDKAGRKAATEAELKAALALPTGTTREIQDRDDRIAGIIERMSTKELEDLALMKKSGADLDSIAKNLSAEKFGALVKDGTVFNEAQKAQLRTSRFRDLSSYQATLSDPTSTPASVANARRGIRQYSSKDLQNAPPELLSNAAVIRALSDSQRDDLIKSDNVSPAITRQLKARDPLERIKAVFNSRGGATAAGFISTLKPKQVAKLPDNILSDTNVMPILSPAMLSAINEAGDISTAARNRIKASLSLRRIADPQLNTYLTGPGGTLWV